MRWDSCGLRWAPWAAVLTVILCRELALPGKAKSIRPFTRCSAGTGQGHSHRPGRRPRSPEGRAAAALGVPGVTYLPGAPWHQNTQPPSAHQGQRPLEESTAPPQRPQSSGTQVPWPGRRPPRTRPPPGPCSPSSRPRPGESLHACPGVPWLWGHRARQPGCGGLWLEPRWVRVGACRSPPSPLAPRAPPSAVPSPGGPESEERRLPADRRGMSSGGSRHVTRRRSSSSPSRGSNFQPQP